MASKTKVTISQLHGMASMVGNAETKISTAKALISSANASLSMEVAARANILALMQRANTIAKKTNSRVNTFKSTTIMAADDFQNADGRSGSQVKSLVGRISTKAVITGALPRVLFSHALTKYLILNSLALFGFRIWGANLPIPKGKGVIPFKPSYGGEIDFVDEKVMINETSINPIAGEPSVVHDKLIQAGKVSKGVDINSFNVIDGIDPEDIICQKNIGSDWFNNNGCTASARAMMNRIMNTGKYYDPLAYGDGRNCPYLNTVSIPGTNLKGNPNLCDRLKIIADYVSHNKPVEIYTKGHSMVVVGINRNADLSNLRMEDLLVIDPSDGMIKTANMYKGAKDLSKYYCRSIGLLNG